MQEITIRDDFIKLGQAMKLAGLVGSGVEAKVLIQDGLVLVNGEAGNWWWEMSLSLKETQLRLLPYDYKIH